MSTAEKDCTCQKYEGRDCRKCFDPPYPDQDPDHAVRTAFEDEVYKDYFIKSVSKKKPNDQFFACGAVDKDVLCKRDVNGNYARPDIDAMWHGWNLSRTAAFKDIASMLAVRATMQELVDYITAELKR